MWTAADLGLAPFQSMVAVHPDFARPPLTGDHVRFVGEGIAVVIAETMTQAKDAADMVVVDYEPLPAAVTAEDALADGAPILFDGHSDNVAMSTTDPVDADLFGDADVIVRGRYVNQRIAVAPMEPHGAAAAIGDDGRLLVYGSTQMPHLLHNLLATALGMDKADIRVIVPLVGGGFGGKAGLYPEQVVVAAAAQAAAAPVLWTATRSEDMVALPHSRGQIQYVELGCKRDGTFTGLRVRLVGDAGAYPGIGCYLPAGTRRMSNGTYRFTGIQFDLAVAATNTTPMGAYRGAGRPGGDRAARTRRRPGRDRARHRPDRAAPPQPARQRRVPVHHADRHHLRQRRVQHPARRGRPAVGLRRPATPSRRLAGPRGDRSLLGIGVSMYVEITAGGGTSEYGAVEVHDDGSATVIAGTSAHGQGHQTAFAMIVNSQTGIPIEQHPPRRRSTPTWSARGGGTGGSRSLQLGGSAVLRATESLVDKAKHLAAQLLEADVGDIVVDTTTGTVGVAGVPATGLDWAALATRGRTTTAASITPTARWVSPPSSTSTRARRRSRSARTSPSSRSIRTPARSRCCGTSPSTTAAPC